MLRENGEPKVICVWFKLDLLSMFCEKHPTIPRCNMALRNCLHAVELKLFCIRECDVTKGTMCSLYLFLELIARHV